MTTNPSAALLGRVGLAFTLAIAHRSAARRHRATLARRPPRAGRSAALLACAPSTVLAVRTARHPHVQWRPPASPTTRVLLVAHVLSSAVIEEVAWRGALTRRRPGPLAVASALGFVAAHLPRDGGRSSGVHVVNAAAWTAAALWGQRLRWPVLAHAGYNIAAHTLVVVDGANA